MVPSERPTTHTSPLRGKKKSSEDLAVEEIKEERPKIGQPSQSFQKPSDLEKKEVVPQKKEPVHAAKVEKVEPIKKFEMPEESPKQPKEVAKKPEEVKKQPKQTNFMDDLDSSFDESKQSDER